jgi:hypothetical protein
MEASMLKLIPLLFVLVAMALVFVAVFLPKSEEVKMAATELSIATQPTQSGTRWAFGVFLLLLSLPGLFIWFGNPDPMTGWFVSLFGIFWVTLITGVSLALLALLLATQVLAAGVPLAQAVGANMTEAQRRSTWRRAKRAFDQFQSR